MNFRDIALKLVLDNGYRDLCEVGVWRGELSRMLYPHARTLVCVDPWSALWNNFEPFLGVVKYDCTMGEPQVTQADLNKMHDDLRRDLPGALILRMPSSVAIKHIPDHSLDFVFIDAVHLREFAEADVKAFEFSLRGGGMLAGDDYCGEVKQAVDIWFDEASDARECTFGTYGPVWWVKFEKESE